jgi:hypothetical protein
MIDPQKAQPPSLMVEQCHGAFSSLVGISCLRDAMNRRKFCLSSIATAISGAAVGAGCPPAAAQTAALPAASKPIAPLYKFVFDRRYSAASAFGVAAEHAKAIAGVVAIEGDITELWSQDLRLQWSTGSGAIAGMATARTLFCLEQLAKDHWMRVAIRVEHMISEGREIAHRLTAAEPMIARMGPALMAEDWPAKMPAALAACRSADGAPRLTRVIGSTCRLAMSDETLVSFVIA